MPTIENGGISADGLNWRIKLRPGVTWHDGTPFTAEDVKFTHRSDQQPEVPCRRRAGHDLVRDIKIVRPHEITWKDDGTNVVYMSSLAWTFIMPSTSSAKAD